MESAPVGNDSVPKLILIGGPPGVGKSTAGRILLDRLSECVWLDGDDLWRMDPFRVDDITTAMVEDNARHVLDNFLGAGFEHVIFTWVMHRQEIVERIAGRLERPHRLQMFTLLCDEQTLVARLGSHASPARIERALTRLSECTAVGATQIDTTCRDAETVAKEIAKHVSNTDSAEAPKE